MTQRHQFDAPWGRGLKVISVLGSLGSSIPIAIGLGEPDMPVAARLACVFSGFVILGSCALFTIRGYRVDGGSVYVRRLLWESRVDLDGLQAVERQDRASIRRGMIKVWGNGGLFSFSGTFRSRELGMFRMYVTDLDRLVLLTIGERKVVMSPDDPEAFIALLRKERRLT